MAVVTSPSSLSSLVLSHHRFSSPSQRIISARLRPDHHHNQLRFCPVLRASQRTPNFPQESDDLLNKSRRWGQVDFWGEYEEEEDDEDDEEEEEDRSLDLLIRFVENVFKKVSRKARKAVRSVLPVAISTKLVGFSVNGALILAFLWVLKAFIEVICTLGSVVFVSILLIRGVWSGVAYLQESRNPYTSQDDEPWVGARPVKETKAMAALLNPYPSLHSTPLFLLIRPSHRISTYFLQSSSLLSSPLILSPSITRGRRPYSHATSFSSMSASEKKKVLIINTDNGAHAAIGFYFAKELLGKGHQATILTVGDETSDNMKMPPFTRFSEIADAGGKTVWGDPMDVADVFGGEGFDVILDNNSKDLDTVRPVVDWGKSSGTTQFLYISSAGIYKPTDEPPHIEGDVVKSDASHVGAEEYVAKVFNSWAIFRPQYVIGSAKHKDCEEWFFDRIVRGRPVPIPGSGIELTNIAHLRDLSSMLTLALEKPNSANGNIFNCVSDRAVTLDGMARLCAQAAGLPLKIIHYDPNSVGVDPKKAFPFRSMHFYAEPRAAKDLLGWECTTYLPEDLKERFEEYVVIGRDKKPMQFELDDKILESLKL